MSAEHGPGESVVKRFDGAPAPAGEVGPPPSFRQTAYDALPGKPDDEDYAIADRIVEALWPLFPAVLAPAAMGPLPGWEEVVSAVEHALSIFVGMPEREIRAGVLHMLRPLWQRLTDTAITATAEAALDEVGWRQHLALIGAAEKQLAALAEARAGQAAAEAREGALRTAIGMDTAWPTPDILRVLAAAAEHLLAVHNCDCAGYERINFAAGAAKQAEGELRAVLAAPAPPPGALLAAIESLEDEAEADMEKCASKLLPNPFGEGVARGKSFAAERLRAAIGLLDAEGE